MRKQLLTCFLVSMSFALYAETRGMTLEDISKIQSVRSLEVSPDGRWLAYTREVPRTSYVDDDGEAWSELYVHPVGGEPKPFITGKVNIGHVQWSENSKTLYYLSKRGDDKHRALYKIAVDGGESQKIFDFKADIENYALTQNRLAFIAKYPEPKYKDALNKKGFTAKIYEEDIQPNHLWLVELNSKQDKPQKLNLQGHISMAKFNPAGDALLIQSAPTSLVDDAYMRKQLLIVDLKGSIQAHFKTAGKLSKAIWSPDGTQVAFLAANDLNDPTGKAVYVGDAHGKYTKLVENIDSHVMDIAWAGQQLYYIEHRGVESRTLAIDMSNQPSTRVKLEQGLGIQNALSASQNGALFVLLNKPEHPQEIYGITTDRTATRLTNSNPWLAEIAMGKQEVFHYSARDGLALQGVLIYPLHYKKGKRYPMIAFIHGGPEDHRSNGWNTIYSWPIHVASAQGYFSFIPNYRGSTGRGLDFSKLDQHAYADPEFTDILDGKLALVEKGLVDKDRTGISGGSYGGYATAWSATALSEHYAAGVMFVGISDQLSKFGTTDIPYEMYHVHARAWPWDNYQWMLERSPIYHVQKAKTPLLILHGENDTRVHPAQSLELYRYLKVLNQAPVRLVLYPGEKHGNNKAAARLDYSMRFMRWMNYYLKDIGKSIPDYDLEHHKKLEAEHADGA